MKKLFFLLLFILFGSASLKAQFLVIGQDPASLKWKQYESESFKIVFPEGFEKKALSYLKTLEISKHATLSPYLKTDVPKFNILLHNQSTLANAIVTPAPLHSDFFGIPGQSLYPQRWEYQLALHEYRHFVQIRKMYRGVGKGLYYVFGQIGPSALLGAFVPFWFIEGDAVFNETIHSKSGRGRYPIFWMDLKAQVLEKGIYKYDKAVLGSYKDYVPDHYTLGYQMLLFGIENYGVEMWNTALKNTAYRPYTFKPFVKSLKKYSGLNKVQYYKFAIGEQKRNWKKEQKSDSVNVINLKRKFFTNYRFPQMLDNGNIIAERSSIDDIRRFVEITQNGDEKVIFTPGFDYNESLSVTDSLICWNEKQYDIRWSNKDYSVIKIYNFKSGKLSQLKGKTRYFAPSITNDGKMIATVSVMENGENSLLILDAVTGEIKQKIHTSDNAFFMTPRWSDDGKFIVAVVLNDKGKSIILYDVEHDKFEYLLPFGFTEINRPFMNGNKVFFTGTWEGKNDIYQLDLNTKEVFKMVNAKYGAEDVTFTKDGRLLFSNYTSDGYKIALANYDKLKKEKTDISKTYSYPVDKLVKPGTFVLEDTTVNTPDYKESRYSKLKHLFNIHSWGPMIVDVNNYEFKPNAVLMSQNLLGTAISTLGYYYDVNEGTGKVKFTFDYTGLFPIIGFGVQYGNRKKNYNDENGNLKTLKWHETDIILNISVPLRFINNKWIRGVKPSLSFGQKFLKIFETPDVSFKEDRFTIFSYGLIAYNSLKRSRLDMFSRWSQSVSVYYNHTPFSSSVSNVSLVAGRFTTPGILRHHGFKVYIGKQWKKDGNYLFGDLISTPRGSSGLDFTDMISLKTDYAFPVAYPDWDVPTIFYLTRIYSHIFYDFAHYKDLNSKIVDLSSLGLELYTNWHFLSLPVEFTLGCRVSYLVNDSKPKAEFLFSFGY